MKNRLLAYCALPLFFAPFAEAGINGTYRVSGSETAAGDKESFTGTVKVASYLFAPGKTWFYYVKGGIPGNEKLVEIQFDDQGLAQSSKLVDANFYGLNRWD